MLSGTAELIVADPRLEAGTVVASAVLKTPASGEVQLWFRVPERYREAVVTSADPFVLVSLHRVMAEAETGGLRRLRVRGSVSPSLVRNLETWQSIWERWNLRPRPEGMRYRPLDIDADELAERWPRVDPSVAVAAFSGGIDSSFTVYRHVTGAARPPRDVRAGVMIHGLDIRLSDQEAFDRAAARGRRLLDTVGVELIEVATNVRDGCVAYEDSYGLFVGGAMTLLSADYGSGLIASGMPYEEVILVHGSTPMTDWLMGSSAFEIVHDGAASDRTDKIAALAPWAEALELSRFCWEGEDLATNCGHCRKCVTTLLMFRLARVEPRCFDNPATDNDVRHVIETMRLEGTGAFYPKQILARADRDGVHEEWVGWLRARLADHARAVTP